MKAKVYKLTIGNKEYKHEYCSIDLSGNLFAIFERRKWLSKDRVKFAKEDLIINHKTGVCCLKEKSK